MKNNDKCYVHPIVNQAGFHSESSFSPKSKYHYPCTQPSWFIAIKVNGDLYPCCPSFYSGGVKTNSLFLGNIKTSSPHEMYLDSASKSKKIIASMRKGDYSSLPECNSCNTYKLSPNIYFKIPFIKNENKYKWF